MSVALTNACKVQVDLGELVHLRDALRQQEQQIRRSLAQIEKALRGINAPENERSDAVNVASPRPSPLDPVRSVTMATADLRAPSGNLSATRIAKVFGVSLSRLAGWLGRTRQAVTKTPDADSLQAALSYFERVARLRLLTQGDIEFRKWLRTPHADINAKDPLALLAQGEWQALADYVDDLLSGTPG